MKGYLVEFTLNDSVPEISRKAVLPKGLSFTELEKIIFALFSFDGYHNSEFRFEKSPDVYYEDKNEIIDVYINDTIYFNYDFGDEWLIVISLKEIVDYDKSYATFESYTGDYNPVEDCGGVFAFNEMIRTKNRMRKINQESIQNKLSKIEVFNYEAYDIKIRCEGSDELLWRDFLIPPKITFQEVEKIIALTFNMNTSFSIDGSYVDGYFKNNSKMFSDDYMFSINIKNIVKYDRTYPSLKRFKGGDNPFESWCQHYPCESKNAIDKNQTTLDDFMVSVFIENTDNIALSNYLENYYPNISKAMQKEKYMIDYDEFDLFYEIIWDDETAGFFALKNYDDDLVIIETYVNPKFRGKNLFYTSFNEMFKATDKRIYFLKPSKILVETLIKNNMAFKVNSDIVVSYVEFIVALDDTYKNLKIKHLYKKAKSDLYIITNLFDLNLCAVLFFDHTHIFTKAIDTIAICEARKYDLKKHSIRKKLKKIQPKYINKCYDLLMESVNEMFKHFKDADVSLTNALKSNTLFSRSHPDVHMGDIIPDYHLLSTCPCCGNIIEKSAIYCHRCGFILDKIVINDKKLYNLDANSDNYLDDVIEHPNNNINNIKSLIEDFKLFSEDMDNIKLFRDKIEQFDFNLLGISKKGYDKSCDDKMKIEKSICEIVRFTDEKPTPWNLDHIYEYTPEDFDLAIDEGYIEKIMPDEFSKRFENFTKEELMLQSEFSIDSKLSKEEVIELLVDEADHSWIVSPKGYEYLNSHYSYVFFTKHLLKYNLYEFMMFLNANKDLTIEEAGNKYINLKIENDLSANYLNYIDYYYTLHLKNKNYDKASIYLIQRIICETNSWLLKDYHVSFDEVYGLEIFYLIFDFVNLKVDFDFETSYKKAFDELKVDKFKINFDKLRIICYRLLVEAENPYVISSELFNETKNQKKI